MRLRWQSGLRRLLRDRRGAAAAEVALWATALMVPVLSIADLTFYTYQKMQVELASQAGVGAAWRVCNISSLMPATANCSGLSAAVTTAIQSTSLGSNVTASISEGWYCVNGSNALVLIGTAGTIATPLTATRPNCTSVGAPTVLAGEYVRVTTSYTFTPPYTGLSMTSLLPSPITKVSWMRLR
jgi:Flp pilus assembly protein TadG